MLRSEGSEIWGKRGEKLVMFTAGEAVQMTNK